MFPFRDQAEIPVGTRYLQFRIHYRFPPKIVISKQKCKAALSNAQGGGMPWYHLNSRAVRGHSASVTGGPVRAYWFPFGRMLQGDIQPLTPLPYTVRQLSACVGATYSSLSAHIFYDSAAFL